LLDDARLDAASVFSAVSTEPGAVKRHPYTNPVGALLDDARARCPNRVPSSGTPTRRSG